MHRYVSKFLKKSDRAVSSHEAKYTNLFVKNLDTGISEEVLTEKFSQFGKILSLVISKDENGASKGFGFVNFDKPEEAKCAVEALYGSQVGNHETPTKFYFNDMLLKSSYVNLWEHNLCN